MKTICTSLYCMGYLLFLGCGKMQSEQDGSSSAPVLELKNPLLKAKAKKLAEDQKEEFNEIKAKAEEGDAEAQFQLGLLYDTGRGVRQNPAKAIRWYRAAADQGHAAAQNNLGLLYDYGRGISQDAAEAMRWYRSAADQGFAVAQYNLGFMYANGRGLAQNYVDAYLWFNLASARASGDIREQAAHNKTVLAQHMTPQQIAQAKRLTGVWTPEP